MCSAREAGLGLRDVGLSDRRFKHEGKRSAQVSLFRAQEIDGHKTFPAIFTKSIHPLPVQGEGLFNGLKMRALRKPNMPRRVRCPGQVGLRAERCAPVL